MEISRVEFDALVMRAGRTDLHLAQTQGEVLALRVAVAALIATHPDKDQLRRVLVGLEAGLQLPSHGPVLHGYQGARGLLAQALAPPPGGSPPR